jgi:hypothetical protein
MAENVLSSFAPLVGEWSLSVRRQGPIQEVGSTSFVWLADGAFLLMKNDVIEGGPPASAAVIGGDTDSGHVQILYHDERRISRIYKTAFQNGVWRIWRDQPGFRQRFGVRLSQDQNEMKGRWEVNKDDRWELDFEVAYRRQ